MYQARYRAYCNAQGRDPEAQMQHDATAFPGGVMTGYILWVRDQWVQWRAAHPSANRFASAEEHDAFDTWLRLTYPEVHDDR